MLKQELRKIYRAKRAAITAQQKLQWDDLMLIQFQQFQFDGAALLLTYWGMEHMQEPNTQPFASYLKHTCEGLQIAYPVADIASATMQAKLVDEDTVFKTNEWGITEPQSATVVSPTAIDIVLVPLLICDKKGYRVGYGKGFYDKYLSACRADVVLIGLNYFEPVAAIEDVHEFDIPLDYCVTPHRIYEF